MKYDVVIVGSGLGGLECGYILSKKGYNVCILEKNPQTGGCLQTFRRGNTTYDTGFHFVGGLDECQALHTFFDYFDLLQLPWQKMDTEAFAEIIFQDKSYSLASGYERFVETLIKDFPKQHNQLRKYTEFLKNVGNGIEQIFHPGKYIQNIKPALFERSAYEFLQETIDDPILRNVLSGASLTMDLSSGKLPLYIFAQINNSFIQSSWRLKGGGAQIASKLMESICSMGGTIITKANVNRLIEQNGKIKFVEYNHSEQVEADYVISNLHPAATLPLISESHIVRNIYRKRISNLPNTFGMFTTHLQLKENTIPYLNRNVFLYKLPNVWDYNNHSTDKADRALISYQIPESESNYTKNIDILTPMRWEEVAKWEDMTIEKRGEEYKHFKQRKAEECIALAAEKIPGLQNNVKKIYTSSPLTYRDYTGTWKGAAYGIQKDYNNVIQTLLSPQTPITNLFLTGQNLNLHGILGVTITSFLSCSKITGNIEELTKDLHW